MPARTSIATDAAGRRVMAKVAGNADEAVRLEREAEQLEAARHPGVVELVGVEGHGVGAILLTAHVDGPALAQVGRLPLEEGAGLLAALATTLADLHDLGIVHGAVSPDHVIVGPGGRPVLCGLAYGGRAGRAIGPAAGTAATWEFADPARTDADVLSPAFDVYALGALARFLAPDPPAGHVMARVAEEATSDDVSGRPSARAVAERLQHEVPAARLPRGLEPRPVARPVVANGADPLAALRRDGRGMRSGRSGRTRVGAALAALAAVAVVVVVAIGLARSPAPPAAVVTELGAPASPELLPPDVAEPGPTTTRARPASSTSTSVTLVPSTTVPPRPGGCPSMSAVLQADIDGDGCPDALRYADGVLEAAGARWSLGQPGDQVATGNWSCQGSRTLALFRPSTGEVFRFDGWAATGHDLTATAIARVQGGQALRAADVDRDGCHEIVVERANGPAEVVSFVRGRP